MKCKPNELFNTDWLAMKYNTNSNSFNSGNPIRWGPNTLLPIQLLSSLPLAHYNIWFCLCVIFNLYHCFFIMSGKSYAANFKLQMITFGKSLNNSVTGNYFSVNEKQVREERKNICILWLFLMHVHCKKYVLIYKPAPLLKL